MKKSKRIHTLFREIKKKIFFKKGKIKPAALNNGNTV